ncbi:hypothetical protein [Bacillus benzoevorans]|uniref:Uncharacterized protein n=1 Tax=Bacillus benzoevorans TaxID=1456 RepID=A0A7X0HSV7_9BACI|nr:hypothetical protein [Bacillus benzoevorans]MBB6446176.1 hypothetical protein [Bacillus benzoevorans]
MNILMIPSKRGRKGHPKITVTSYDRIREYEIYGNSSGIVVHESNRNEEEGINRVLVQLFDELKNRKR